MTSIPGMQSHAIFLPENRHRRGGDSEKRPVYGGENNAESKKTGWLFFDKCNYLRDSKKQASA